MRLIRIIPFTLLIGCTGGPGGTRGAGTMATVLSDLCERTHVELREKEYRRVLREQQRERGLRVCEEGEWPQRWGEGCNTCGCDEGDVRWCTQVYCPERSKQYNRNRAPIDAPRRRSPSEAHEDPH